MALLACQATAAPLVAGVVWRLVAAHQPSVTLVPFKKIPETPRRHKSLMSIRITVLDPLPAYRCGIITSIGHSAFSPTEPEDLLTWILREPRHVVFLTLESQSDWMLLTDLLQARSDAVVVAVLTDISTSTYVRAISAGAATAVSRDAPPEQMKRVFDEAVNGMSLLPMRVVRALKKSEELAEKKPNLLTTREIEWLRELSYGTTVSQLAEKAGYSERAMFRLLRDLYERMKVKSRMEALVHAHQAGWL